MWFPPKYRKKEISLRLECRVHKRHIFVWANICRQKWHTYSRMIGCVCVWVRLCIYRRWFNGKFPKSSLACADAPLHADVFTPNKPYAASALFHRRTRIDNARADWGRNFLFSILFSCCRCVKVCVCVCPREGCRHVYVCACVCRRLRVCLFVDERCVSYAIPVRVRPLRNTSIRCEKLFAGNSTHGIYITVTSFVIIWSMWTYFAKLTAFRDSKRLFHSFICSNWVCVRACSCRFPPNWSGAFDKMEPLPPK